LLCWKVRKCFIFRALSALKIAEILERREGGSDKQKSKSKPNQKPKQNPTSKKCVICDRVTVRDNIDDRRLDFALDRLNTCNIKNCTLKKTGENTSKSKTRFGKKKREIRSLTLRVLDSNWINARELKILSSRKTTDAKSPWINEKPRNASKRSHRYKDSAMVSVAREWVYKSVSMPFAGRGVYAMCASIPSATWLTDWLSPATRLLFNTYSPLRTPRITQLHRSRAWVESLSTALSNYQHTQAPSLSRSLSHRIVSWVSVVFLQPFCLLSIFRVFLVFRLEITDIRVPLLAAQGVSQRVLLVCDLSSRSDPGGGFYHWLT